ncbi:MAG: hypothetical protein A2W11_03770 [Ignavibacteria bacterium RBG_16_35_7]|nr:MAG: hypothetical protein A2W11_03770 [Ignavibacteria bacterium RBG_16_35_7]
MPSSNLFISQGATVSNLNHKAKLTGTLGIHYYFTNYFGVSMQTNFINDLGWYQDLAISRNDFKLNLSLGYSAIYNSPSVSLRICYRLRNFFY